MIVGTVYGVVLNDAAQRLALSAEFRDAPYRAPPVAPVVYIKPRNCFSWNGSPIRVPAKLSKIEIAATVGLFFGRDVSGADFGSEGAIAAACLALDICQPHASFYRPALVERCRDGFLPMGALAACRTDLSSIEIVTSINGEERHRWSLDRLMRDVPQLIRDISSFMTFAAGDLLLVGLPGDAPRAKVGDRVGVTASNLPPISVNVLAEEPA